MKTIFNILSTLFVASFAIILIFGSNAYGQAQCELSVNHGQGYTTTIQSVVDNCDGTHTITLRVDHNGCSGPACKELSNYTIQAASGTYSNVNVNVTSGSMTYSNVDMGPNLGALIPYNGFKVDGISGIGDGMAGSFTVTYTLSGGLQNQQVAVKPGPDVLVKSFSIADFESVMNCAGTGCNNQVGPFVNKFPHSGFGTLAFEDLWPSKGDFDFNDLVIDYQFEITSNASNFIEKVDATFIIRAFGAAYQNGFGFQLSNSINASDLTVTGTVLTENYITLSPNGTEAGQNAPTIIVFDNAYGIMDHPGHGAIGVNTELGIPFVEPDTVSIRINFPPNKYTWNDLDIVNFNPFLIANMERGREIHLPGYMPTALANPVFFGRNDDATNVAQGKTYVTSNNLPWAIHIFESFAYPIERQDVIWVHLKFVEWAESGGELFPDWYKNLSGYRNQALIYKRP